MGKLTGSIGEMTWDYDRRHFAEETREEDGNEIQIVMGDRRLVVLELADSHSNTTRPNRVWCTAFGAQSWKCPLINAAGCCRSEFAEANESAHKLRAF